MEKRFANCKGKRNLIQVQNFYKKEVNNTTEGYY